MYLINSDTILFCASVHLVSTQHMGVKNEKHFDFCKYSSIYQLSFHALITDSLTSNTIALFANLLQ